MKVTDLLKYLKDAGLIGGMAAALLWMNGRLNKVETRLYDCLEERAIVRSATISNKSNTLEASLELYAVKPKKIKIKNESTSK